MRESISTFGLLCALKKSIFESYVNKPLRLHMPTKLKHFTQLAKNTQFSSVFFSLVFFSSFFFCFSGGGGERVVRKRIIREHGLCCGNPSLQREGLAPLK